MTIDMDTMHESRVESSQSAWPPAPAPSARPKEKTEEDAAGARVVILAGGDGTRSLAVTRVLSGDDRPKQFTALVGTEPLLVQAERRAVLVAPAKRTHIVLTRKHATWYREILASDGAFRLLVQPQNRGTGTAVLYALLRISAESPHAPVVILPSDHWVSSDSAFMLHAQAAVDFVEEHPAAVVLLGVPPTRPESEYGWIEPGPTRANGKGFAWVSLFVEKPAPSVAGDLFKKGTSLWNTSVVVARAEELLLRFAMARPELVDAFMERWSALGSDGEDEALQRLYAELPVTDLSRDILTSSTSALSVLAVRGVAWEDLGHPRGILEARRLRDAPAWIEARGSGFTPRAGEPGIPRRRSHGSRP
jgi:mannose-1-phosphate guanylyltransferase